MRIKLKSKHRLVYNQLMKVLISEEILPELVNHDTMLIVIDKEDLDKVWDLIKHLDLELSEDIQYNSEE